MNRIIEKWLTIAALAGWIASIGGLVGLAIRATDAPAASRVSQPANVSVQNAEQQSLILPESQSDSVTATAPSNTQKNIASPR
jgi:hypothetical protein